MTLTDCSVARAKKRPLGERATKKVGDFSHAAVEAEAIHPDEDPRRADARHDVRPVGPYDAIDPDRLLLEEGNERRVRRRQSLPQFLPTALRIGSAYDVDHLTRECFIARILRLRPDAFPSERLAARDPPVDASNVVLGEPPPAIRNLGEPRPVHRTHIAARNLERSPDSPK